MAQSTRRPHRRTRIRAYVGQTEARTRAQHPMVQAMVAWHRQACSTTCRWMGQAGWGMPAEGDTRTDAERQQDGRRGVRETLQHVVCWHPEEWDQRVRIWERSQR